MRWSAHISWLFAELPYLERVGAARRGRLRDGRNARGRRRRTTARGSRAVVAEHGVDVALLNCPAGDTAGGERGFVNDDSRREEAERAFADGRRAGRRRRRAER